MFKKSSIVVAALFGALAVVSARSSLPAPVPEQLLKAKEQEKLGATIKDWIESLSDPDVSRLEARDDVQAELDKWRKKRDAKGRDPLALTEDLGRAIWFSKNYAKAKGIKKGKVAEIEIETLARVPSTIEFALHAPSKYRAKTGPYPLIFCIPDASVEPGADLTENWINKDIRDGAILAAVPMPEDTSAWNGPEGVVNFFTVFKRMTEVYAVDFDRIYVAGRGRGVETAMYLAASFPDRFAGVIGRSGEPGTVSAKNFRNLPTFFASAGKQATAFAEACKQEGHENVDIIANGKEADIWSWIQGHPRVSNPTEVVLVPGSPFPNKAYWLAVPGFENTDGKASIRAVVDRSANTITIQAEGIDEVTLFLNDVLVDLDRPVKVICNGVEHEDKIPRSLNVLLDSIGTSRSDPGKLYTASMRYDLPATE